MPAKRLALLIEIADIKATHAKASAARNLRVLQALENQTNELKRQKATILGTSHDPESALVASRWVLACDIRIREFSGRMATARATYETARTHARFEEGRRQVLSKLKGQAS